MVSKFLVERQDDEKTPQCLCWTPKKREAFGNKTPRKQFKSNFAMRQSPHGRPSFFQCFFVEAPCKEGVSLLNGDRCDRRLITRLPVVRGSLREAFSGELKLACFRRQRCLRLVVECFVSRLKALFVEMLARDSERLSRALPCSRKAPTIHDDEHRSALKAGFARESCCQ
ncbi:MAG TPA: hypothetical protein DD490_05480 [Acidobacteria bacterium]|nr:hypothetical protein [Acidobacteriota bacterium]